MESRIKDKKKLTIEFSLNRKEFYPIKGYKINESEIIEKAILFLYFHVKKLTNENEFHQNKSPLTEFYLRLNFQEVECRFDEILNEAEKVYGMLTKKEKEILCFIYKGYDQYSIISVFKITLYTFYGHRKAIYSKLGSHKHTDLVTWCDKFLNGFFETC